MTTVPLARSSYETHLHMDLTPDTQPFTELRDDLEALGNATGNVHCTARRDALLDHPVIQFIEGHVLISTWLRPIDARSICRSPA
jgi:hypothetical protein